MKSLTMSWKRGGVLSLLVALAFWVFAGGISRGQSSTLRATIKTEMGDMQFELWPDAAPQTVANFVFLAQIGFYEGTGFHRVIKTFMVQGGDPASRYDSLKNLYGSCGPAYTIPDEFHDRGVKSAEVNLTAGATEVPMSSTSGISKDDNVRGDGIEAGTTVASVSETGFVLSSPATKTTTSKLRFGTQHVRGTLSMAHSSAANSGGSQFFVVTEDSPHLDGGYAAFGRLVSGDDVLTKLSVLEVTSNPGGEVSAPKQIVRVKSVTVSGVTPPATMNFSGRTFGGGLYLKGDVDMEAWGWLLEIQKLREKLSEGASDPYANSSSRLFGGLFACKPSGQWVATLGPVSKSKQTCSVKLRLNRDGLLTPSLDIPISVVLSQSGDGTFTGTSPRDILLDQQVVYPQDKTRPAEYYYEKKITSIRVDRIVSPVGDASLRVSCDVTQRYYTISTRAEVKEAATKLIYTGFSSDVPAPLQSRYTSTISKPGNLRGEFDPAKGEYSSVGTVSGIGYFSLSVTRGLAVASMRFPNDRTLSLSVPARMSGTRCVLPVSHAAVSSGAFLRATGHIEAGNGVGSGEVDWLHWPLRKGAVITDPLKTEFLGRSSISVHPYSPPPVGRLGLFGPSDSRVSVKMSGQITKVLGAGAVPKRGSQVLTEMSSKTPLKVTVDPLTGVFSGSFTEVLGKTSTKRSLSGVLLQSSRVGMGYSPRGSEVIAVELGSSTPSP